MAPVAQAAPAQIPFYKSSTSQFPSGYTTSDQLVKNQLALTRKSQLGYMARGQFYDLSEIQPITALHLSRNVLSAKSGERLKVLQVKTTGLETLSSSSNKKDFFRFDEIRNDNFDLGTVVTLKDVYLRKEPSERSQVRTTIPKGFRLSPQKFTKQYVEVKYLNYIGYIPLSDLLTKFDFATMALVNGEWLMIDRREGGQIVSHLKEMIDLKDVTAFVTPESKGIVGSQNQIIPFLTPVEKVTLNEPIWRQSQLKGHGLVWWKKNILIDEIQAKDEVILVDQLLKRSISSVSFHPKNPLKGVVSSKGVYITKDGLHWRKVNQFLDFNGPVYYFNDNLIFVGHFRSLDGGRTFENYIQIEKISAAIEKTFGVLPKQLLVEKIDTRPPFKLNIEVDAGFRKIKLESPLFSQNWKALKTN